MKTNRLEGEVKAGIEAYLTFRPDFFFWRQNTAVTKIEGRFMQFGIPGQPDYLGCQAPMGRMVGIEVKREIGGEMSKDQIWWAEMLMSHGGLYVLARSVEDVHRELGEPQARVVKLPRRKRAYPR